MKRLLLILALALPCYGQILAPILQKAPVAAAGVDAGFDFRTDTSYVSDNTNCPVSGKCTCVGDASGTCASSGTWQGITWSWPTAPDGCRNRNAGNDSRLAGMCYHSNSTGTSAKFRMVLPSTGTYTITLAMGDASNPQTQTVSLQDNGVQFASCTAVSTGSNSFADATCTSLSAASWPGSNTTINHTFTTTTFDVVIGGATDAVASTLTHIFVHK